MITKYNIDQCVLFKGVIKGIRTDEDGRTYYFLKVKADRPQAWEENITVEEEQIVCGWVKGGDTE